MEYIRRALEIEDMLEESSLFLFGPRMTGKTSYIENELQKKAILSITFLDGDTLDAFRRNPVLLRSMLNGKTEGFVIVDEVQLFPPVLLDIQHIMTHSDIQFLLTGSSARKLKKSGSNLLGGRAGIVSMHPLVWKEIGDRNPDLDFSVAPMPVADDFTGTSGLMYAPWGVGVSASSEHPDEAWRLVEYLMSPEVNAQIAELASGLPGNKTAVAESDDPAFQQGQAIFQNCELINEFIGMPVASELQRIFGEEVQAMIEQGQSIEETLQNVQDSWNDTLGL